MVRDVGIRRYPPYPPGDWRELVRINYLELLARDGNAFETQEQLHNDYLEWTYGDPEKNRFAYRPSFRVGGKTYRCEIAAGPLVPGSDANQAFNKRLRFLTFGLEAALKVPSSRGSNRPALASPNVTTRNRVLFGILYLFRDYLVEPSGLAESCTYGGLATRFKVSRDHVINSVRFVRSALRENGFL